MPQALRRSLSVATATAVAASALVALGGAGVANAAAYPTINEFSNNIDGTDAEYVELHAAPGTDLAGHTILVVRGQSNAGAVTRATPVSGVTDANGLLNVPLPANGILNSTISLLLVSGTAPTVGTDLDTNDDGVLDVPLTIVDSIATLNADAPGFTYGGVTLEGDFRQNGGASRIDDGVDTDAPADWARNAYSGYGLPGREAGAIAVGEAINTPGQPNAIFEGGEEEPPVEPEPDACAAVATPIGTVQGAGAASPFVDQSVTVEGVVTAVQPGLSGVTIQSLPDGIDADPATSEGLFVFSSAAATQLAVGNHVQITGVVTERFEQTQIAGTTRVLCAEAAPVPAPVELTLPLVSPEATESMLVTFPADLTILETYDFARYGELALGTGLQYQPTDVHEPGSPEAQALLEANWANRILLDDAVSAQNPDPARHPDGQPYTLENRFRAGDLVTGVTGTLGYSFDQWRIQPTVGATVTTVNERPDVPEVGGDLQVAAFNVLNYFTTLGSRGADTALELERQTAKIVAAIVAMDADVVGLMEIENGGEALDALVAAINAQTDRPYTAIETGTIGTDEISTALIYRADAVTPEGAWVALGHGGETAAGFDPSLHRPALTQSFAVTGTDEVLTISVNHLKSKGSECSSGTDPNGQGNCNPERTAAAEALATWLATDPTESGSTHAMIIGDLNAYAMEDPIVALEDAGYTDLLPVHDGPGEYTYTFDGMLGSLDHAMASASVAPLVVDAAAWHTNTDEVSLIDYSMEFKQPAQDAIYAPDPYRASDHDAVLVGLAFDDVEPEPEPSQPAPSNPAPSMPGEAGGGSDAAPGTGGGSGALPTTGGDVAVWLLGLAVALVAAGALLGVRRAHRGRMWSHS